MKIYSILNNPDEIMARVVDSLYSLYFGPVTQSNFQLNEDDLDFLEKFKFVKDNKEILLFRKGIEKYKIGLQMLEEGYDPIEIREKLEYATAFKFKGIEYNWPESEFKIKGKIPNFEY